MVQAYSSSDAFVDSIGVNTLFSGRFQTQDSNWLNSFSTIQNLFLTSGIRHCREGILNQTFLGTATYNTCISTLKAMNSSNGITYDFTTNNAGNQTSDIVAWCLALGPSLVASLEGTNEPSTSSIGSDITGWQQPMYNAVKANASLSSILIVSPSYTNQYNASDPTTSDAYVAVHNSPSVLTCMTGINFHPYQGSYAPETGGWGNNGYGSLPWQFQFFVTPYGGSYPVIATECTYNSLPTPSTSVGWYAQFNNVSGATSYIVQSSTNNGATWSTIGTYSASGTTVPYNSTATFIPPNNYGNGNPGYPAIWLYNQSYSATLTFQAAAIVGGVTQSYVAASYANPDNCWIDETSEAIFTLRFYVWYFIHGVSRSYKYDFVDNDPRECGYAIDQFSFGMIRLDLSVKPVYTAIQNFITLMADPGTQPTILGSLNYSLSAISLANTNVGQALFQRIDGSFTLILWLYQTQNNNVVWNAATLQDAPSSTPQNVTITVSGVGFYKTASPNVSKMWSSVNAISGGKIVVSVTDSILLINFSGSSSMTRIVNARDLRNNWGVNGGAGGSNGTPAGIAAGLNYLQCRWLRNDLVYIQGVGGSAGSGAAAIATLMVNNGYYDPNPKFQTIIDDYVQDSFTWTQQQTYLKTALLLKNQNGTPLFAAVEGPNEVGCYYDGGGSVNPNSTTLIEASDKIDGVGQTNCMQCYGNWSQAISVFATANPSLFTGIQIVAPTILDGVSNTPSGTGGLPGNWQGAAYPNGAGINVSSYIQYGNIHYYPQGPGNQTTSSGSVTSINGNTSTSQNYGAMYPGFCAGESGGGTTLPMILSETNASGYVNEPGAPNWAPDLVSVAWCNMSTFLDHFCLGGKRISYYTMTYADDTNFYLFSGVPPAGPTPTATCLANISTLLSLGNVYNTAANLPLTDVNTFSPGYTGSNFSITVTSGTANFGRATGSGSMICAKSDGSTMIPIWRQPQFDDASETNTVNGALTPTACHMTINLGSTQTWNVWDPTGATAAQQGTRTIALGPKIIASGTGTSIALVVYAAPLFIELTSSSVTSAPITPTGLTLGLTTSSTQAITWTAITTGTAVPTNYFCQLSTDNATWTTVTTTGIGDVGSYTYVGLTAQTLYYYRIYASNSIGSSGFTASVNSTTSATSSGGGSPILVQANSFRSDQPTAASTITLSLTSPPSSGNSIWVMFNGYSGGPGGTNSNNILAPTGSVVVSQANYDGNNFEVTWAWIVPFTTTNTWTFANFDYQNNAGWKIFEISGYSTYDTNHGTVTSETATAVTWPLVTPTSLNVYRITLLALQFDATVGTPSAGVSLILGDSPSPLYHQGILLTEAPTTASPVSLGLTNGTPNDTSAYLSIQIYGGNSLPNQVTGVTLSAATYYGFNISWMAVTGATSYTVNISSTSATTGYTLLASLGATSTSTVASGLLVNQTYWIEIAASNTAGLGSYSTAVSIKTLAEPSLLAIQTAVKTDLNGTGSISASFTNPTTIGNTLLFYFAGQVIGNTNLVPPGGSSNQILIGSTSNNFSTQMFWTQVVTSSSLTYSFAGYTGPASLSIIEVQGVTGFSNLTASGTLTYVEGSPGSVTVPIIQASATPNIGFYFVEFDIAPGSYGSMPANILLLQSPITTLPNYGYHQTMILESSATTGNVLIPFTEASGVTQGSSPMYVGINVLGVTSATPPGATTLSFGTSTTTTQPLTWTSASGSVSNYVVKYSPTSSMINALGVTVAALLTTITGLVPNTLYYYTITAYNGTTPGTTSIVQSNATQNSGAVLPVLIGGKPLLIGGKVVVAP